MGESLGLFLFIIIIIIYLFIYLYRNIPDIDITIFKDVFNAQSPFYFSGFGIQF